MSSFARLRSWLKDYRKVASSKTKHVRYRPLVEQLEDRYLPSTVSATPVFNEDFNQPAGSPPLTSTWTYNTGTDPNNTAVSYVDNASTLSVVNDPSASDGKALGMTIYPTSAGDKTFDSARINTAGNPADNFEYGLIEASIKLPGGPTGQGDGLWPAFWMLGSNHQTGVAWPNCGEIDIMEQGAGGPSVINGSTHFGNISGATRHDTTATYTLPGGQDFYNSYHTFAVYWTPGSITFSVDGIVYDTVARSSYSASLWDQTFDQPFYLILNVNDGGPGNSGGFGGPVTASSTFPQTMDVDYVRVYSLTGVTTPTNFTATASGTNTVNLSWQDPADDETGFVLQRSTTADFSTIDATINLPQGATNYQDTTGAPGTTYYYRLLAVATDGTHNYQSSYSNATATTTGVGQTSPVITSGVAPVTATAGSAYSYRFTATGSPTPTLSASGVPSWLTFTASTGVLSGTPTAANDGTSATITLTANNGVSPNASMTFTISVAAPATPALVVSSSTLNLGATTAGTAGAAQTFTVSGSHLTSSLLVNAPAGVELSSNGSTYSSTLTLASAATGTVPATTITARIAATASAGTIGGAITVSSSGATSQNIAVSGNVTSAGPAGGGIPFVITNQTGQQVNFTLYGLNNSTGQWSYFATSSTGNTFTGTWVPAQQLGAGKTLPTYSFTGSSATLELPPTPEGISAGALVMTVGTIAPSVTVSSSFTILRPSPSNPSLVSATTNPYFDYIEFTLDSNNTLNIDTTQVDQFGFPITLSASPLPSGAPVGVTTGITRDAIIQAFSTFLNQQPSPATQDYSPLIIANPNGSPFRIISPGQYLAIPGNNSVPLNSYFNGALQSFFTAPPPLTLLADGISFTGTATTHNPVASGDLINGVADTNPADNHNFNVIDFVGSGALAGTNFYVYSPLSAPSWVGSESAGEQVFANNGVFADNGERFSGQDSSILGSLENQVVSALNRGLANEATPGQYANTTAFWTDPAQAYPAGQVENLYAKFLHTGTINGTPIFIGSRVYAFPYDDQGGQASFFAVSNPTSVSITLGPWSSSQSSPVITSGTAPTTATTGSAYSYQLKATGSPTPTLSASGLPSWLTFNASTGVLSGTPTAANAGTSATITLTANNGVSPNTSRTFTIDVAAPATPALVVSSSTLNLGATTAGTAGAAQTFTVSGGNLTGDLVVNALAGVELSSNGTTYGVSLALVPNATGTMAPTTIWARIATTASAGTISGDITVTSAGATTQDVAVSGTVSAVGPPALSGNTLYLLSSASSATAGTLSAQPGSGAAVDTISSAGGTNHDGTPANPLVFVISGLTGTYNPAAKTQFALFVDAGTNIANGTQIQISYDFNGDGVVDRVETYHYFAEDNRVGWETYTQAAGLESATGSFANFVNGSIKVEIWNAIGKAPVSLRTNASESDGMQSEIQVPFTNLTQTGTAHVDLALNRPVVASSLENNSYPAANAVDGNSATRWSSQFSDPQWIYVDLGATYNITEVSLNWETAAGKNYQIQVSADATNWTTIDTITGNTTAGVHDYTGLSGTGRYVRIYGTARATPYGYSLYDINVYGTSAVTTGTTLLSRSAWTATASSTEPGGSPQNALDGSLATRWSSGMPMTGGEWFQIDLGSVQTFDRIVLDSGNSVNDYARGYQILTSNNGTDWATQSPVAVGTGTSALIDVSLASPVSARYIRIVQTGASSYWWSIAELNLYV